MALNMKKIVIAGAVGSMVALHGCGEEETKPETTPTVTADGKLGEAEVQVKEKIMEVEANVEQWIAEKKEEYLNTPEAERSVIQTQIYTTIVELEKSGNKEQMTQFFNSFKTFDFKSVTDSKEINEGLKTVFGENFDATKFAENPAQVVQDFAKNINIEEMKEQGVKLLSDSGLMKDGEVNVQAGVEMLQESLKGMFGELGFDDVDQEVVEEKTQAQVLEEVLKNDDKSWGIFIKEANLKTLSEENLKQLKVKLIANKGKASDSKGMFAYGSKAAFTMEDANKNIEDWNKAKMTDKKLTDQVLAQKKAELLSVNPSMVLSKAGVKGKPTIADIEKIIQEYYVPVTAIEGDKTIRAVRQKVAMYNIVDLALTAKKAEAAKKAANLRKSA